MNANAYPGYEYHLNLYDIIANGSEEEKEKAREEQRKYISGYVLPEGMTMKDITITGPDGNPITLRIYTPAGLPERAPMLLEIHGGGFVGGSLDIDNYRCIYLAQHTPCIVIGVDYRLCNDKVHFPAPLMDCYAALNWIYEHGDELGGDRERIAVHGTSAGANLTAGLALYARDHKGPKITMSILNCPPLTIETFTSTIQNNQYSLGSGGFEESVEYIYLNDAGYNGGTPNYYAMPGYCRDLRHLPATYIIVAEYDPLRDDGLAYANRLLKAGVPCEVIVAPRVGHGFCVVDHPLTRWVHNGVCASLRREFGMEIREF